MLTCIKDIKLGLCKGVLQQELLRPIFSAIEKVGSDIISTTKSCKVMAKRSHWMPKT